MIYVHRQLVLSSDIKLAGVYQTTGRVFTQTAAGCEELGIYAMDEFLAVVAEHQSQRDI
jgi:hypothetical protein